MTNNDELAMKLKAAAEMATPGEWERGDGKHGGELLVYCDDALGSAVCEATSTYNSIPKLQRIINLTFIATANPANILSLLAERDADKKRIEQLQQRVGELEAKNALVAGGISATSKLYDRIHELEARTVSVKLPEPFTKSMYGTALYEHDDIVTMLAAAGIKLEVGE